MAAWILTGSVENFRINVERGFDVIGFKERRRNQAGRVRARRRDRLLHHRRAGVRRHRKGPLGDVRGPDPIWPQGRKKHPEDYPWRVEAEPLAILDEEDFVAAD